MKLMKNLLKIGLTLLSITSLVACGSNGYKEQSADAFYLKHAYSFDPTTVKSGQHLLSGFYHNTEEFGNKVIISLVHNSDGDHGTGGSGQQYKYIEEFLKKRKDVKFYCIYMDSYLGGGKYYKDKINAKTGMAYGTQIIDTFYNNNLADIMDEAKEVYMNSPFGSHDYDLNVKGDFSWVYGWGLNDPIPFNFYVDNAETKPSYHSKIYQLSEIYPFHFDSVETIENMVDHQGFFKE